MSSLVLPPDQPVDSEPAPVTEQDPRATELEREQAHVAMLYGWLDRARERARSALDRSYRADGSTHQAKVDRDATVALYASRLAQLQAVEHGLCIGRLDRRPDPDDGRPDLDGGRPDADGERSDLDGRRSDADGGRPDSPDPDSGRPDPDGGQVVADGGPPTADRLYVGRIGLSDDDYEPLMIDWRAPAAEPFYRATAHDPGGVTRRRHFQTAGRRVTGYHDDVLDLDALGDAELGSLNGEAALLAALDARRTGRMGDIVATIQAEQDRVIRADLPGILVIQGGPGTGKTAVALHRAAYLLYTHRDRLARRGVLVVGPNPTFLRYIQQVLPSLGETDVLLSTVQELFPGVSATGREPVEAAALKGETRMAEVLARAVRDRQRVPGETVEIRVDGQRGGGVVALTPAAAENARALARASGQPHNAARGVFVAEVLRGLARQIADRIEAEMAAVEELIDNSAFGPDEQLDGSPYLSAEQLADIRTELLGNREIRALLDDLWPDLTPRRLLTDLFSSPERLAAAGLRQDEAALLLRRAPRTAAGTGAESGLDSTQGGPPAGGLDGTRGWTRADVPLLDEAAELLGDDGHAARSEETRRAATHRRDLAYAEGVLEIAGVEGDVYDEQGELAVAQVATAEALAARYRRYDEVAPLAQRARWDRTWRFGHVIVDEAQELAPMEWRMLVRRCPSRSMTVVGDLAQTGSPSGAASWAQALEPHAGSRWRQERLTVNYRTPAEIMALAAEVLTEAAPGEAPPRSVRSTGVAPWTLRLDAADLPAKLPGIVAAEAEEVDGGKLAVIAPDALAGTLGARLAAELPGAAVGAGPDALDAPVAVLTVTQAKGLEFDGVIVVEPAGILDSSPNGANDLYVALTRATQRLGIVHVSDLPPALARAEATEARARTNEPTRARMG